MITWIVLGIAISAVALAAPFYKAWSARRGRRQWRDYDGEV